MPNALSRRVALSLALAAVALPAAAARPVIKPLTDEEKAAVAQASAYLQGLSGAKGRFIQTDARGQATAGDLYLSRPGKARFAYDPPSGLLIVSNGKTVSVANPRLKTFNTYPLSRTPLALFLAREVRLDKGVVVSRVERFADGFSITARDGRREAEGQITLTFNTSPMALTGWTIADAQGQKTTVKLVSLAPASPDPSLFAVRAPTPSNPEARQ